MLVAEATGVGVLVSSMGSVWACVFHDMACLEGLPRGEQNVAGTSGCRSLHTNGVWDLLEVLEKATSEMSSGSMCPDLGQWEGGFGTGLGRY